MYEALATTDCEQLLFMDDDILLEPDSVLRAIAFSRHAREPMLVGGQMLAAGPLAAVDHGRGRRPAPLPVAQRPAHRPPPRPRRPPAAPDAMAAPAGGRRLQRLVDVPDPARRRRGARAAAAAVHQVGRRRVRAARPRAGYCTATVPGIAIWHMSFEKDDTSDWQAYFHYRNRLVAAALHGPDDPRGISSTCSSGPSGT